MHPPYHNIIRFSENPAVLSNCLSPETFTPEAAGPLQNMLTSALMTEGSLKLKSLIVKNIANNRAKRNLERLWRYRALKGGFYIFKHEYIALFQKTRDHT